MDIGVLGLGYVRKMVLISSEVRVYPSLIPWPKPLEFGIVRCAPKNLILFYKDT